MLHIFNVTIIIIKPKIIQTNFMFSFIIILAVFYLWAFRNCIWVACYAIFEIYQMSCYKLMCCSIRMLGLQFMAKKWNCYRFKNCYFKKCKNCLQIKKKNLQLTDWIFSHCVPFPEPGLPNTNTTLYLLLESLESPDIFLQHEMYSPNTKGTEGCALCCDSRFVREWKRATPSRRFIVFRFALLGLKLNKKERKKSKYYKNMRESELFYEDA